MIYINMLYPHVQRSHEPLPYSPWLMHKKTVSLPARSRILDRWTLADRPNAWSMAAALLAGLAIAASHARAQDNYTYTGTNGTSNTPMSGTTFAGAFADTTTGFFNVTPTSPAGTLTFGGGATMYTAVDDLAALTLNGGLTFTNTTGTITINSNGATFNAGGATLNFALGTGNVAFAPAINLGAAALAFTGSGTGQATTVSGVIGGTGGVTYGTAGTLTLGGTNTYTGGTTINSGAVVLGTGGGAGTVRGAVTVNTGATLTLSATDALGYTGGQAITVLNINSGTVNSTSNGNEGFITGLNLTGGTFTNTGGGTFNIKPTDASAPGITSNASATTSLISSGIDLRNGGSLSINVAKGTTASGNDLTISSVVSSLDGQGGGFTKTGAGQLNLTGASTFTGNVAINAGTVNIGAAGADGGVSSALGATNGKTITIASGATLSGTVNNWFGRGADNGALPTITVNGGGILFTTRYTVLGAVNLNGGTMTSNDVTDVSGFQAYQLRGNVTVGGTTPSTIASQHVDAISGGVQLDLPTTFMVNSTGATGADLTVSAPLRNRSGDYSGFPGGSVGGLTKAGAGTMLLTAVSTYTGATTVNAGSLFVGTGGGLAAGSAVSVNNTGTVLGGTGTIAGTVAVGAGATLTAGNKALATPATGNLTTGALTLATGSTFNALLASNANFSTLNAAGTTALGGAAFSISLASGASFASGSVLQLITSNVSGTFTDASFTTGGYQFAADYNTDPGFFDVDVTAVPEPSTISLCGVLLVGLVGVTQRRQIRGHRDGTEV